MRIKGSDRFRLQLWIGLLMLVVVAGGGGLAPARAASPDQHVVVEARSFVEARLVSTATLTPASTMVVKLTTQFWSDGKRLSPEDLLSVAPHIRFVDSTARGHSILLAVPPTGAVQLAAVQKGETYTLSFPALASPQSAETAEAVATINEPVWLRAQRVVRLRFQPVRYDPTTQTISVHPEIAVTLDLEDDRASSVLPPPDPHWEPIYQQSVSNYQEGLRWRRVPDPLPDTLAGAAPAPVDSAWRLRITVTQPGLYEVGYDDLARLGADLEGVDPRRLQLFDGVLPLPSLVRGEGDGRLDPGDAVIFYAPPVSAPSRYAVERVFWLVLGAGSGSRVAQRSTPGQGPVLSSFQHTAHLEVQRLYLSSFPPLEDSDHWFWLSLRPERSGPARQTASFSLAGVATGPDRARLRIRVWGQDDGIATVNLSLAGYPVGAFAIQGRTTITRDYVIPHALLHNGVNDLAIEASKSPTSTNTVLLDWLEVDYTRLYQAVDGRMNLGVGWAGRWQVWLDGLDATAIVWDVTDPMQPVALTDVFLAGDSFPDRVGFTSMGQGPLTYETATAAARRPASLAWVPVLDDLRSSHNRADYLIIAPESMLPAAQQLALHRADYGLAVKVITTQAIYDEFNAGRTHPQAIRSFLSTALSRWRAPAPAFVLLLGDATTDPLGYLASPPVGTPVFLRLVDPWLGEVADENAYAAVAGDDIVPDLMLGRLPAGSLADAEQLVAKIVQYDDLPFGDSWQQRLLLAADNPDGAGDFTTLAEDVAVQSAPSLDVTRLYLADYPSADQLRADLLAGWNSGALIVNYIGHGHPSAWASESILSKADAPLLQNRDRPAVVLAMASLAGIFAQPGTSSLLEDLLFLPEGRGAVGYIASTGYGIAVGNALVNEGFMDAVLADKVDLLGQATIQAKLHLYTQGYAFTEFLTRLYTLVGDPATKMPLAPWAKHYYLPLVTR